MKDTGLLFNAPLVRAILTDLKTQTRRVAKLPHMNPLGEWEATTVGGPGGGRTSDGKEIPLQPAIAHTRTGDVICAPYLAGDRIYVRETWAPNEVEPAAHRPHADFLYAASDAEKYSVSRWRPSIHMPKAAARIWLEVTGVRVERLQEITDADALAEGVDRTNTSIPGYARERFQKLWDTTTGRPALPVNKDSKRYARVKHWLDTHPDITGWDANPWVWVVDFKRIEKH